MSPLGSPRRHCYGALAITLVVAVGVLLVMRGDAAAAQITSLEAEANAKRVTGLDVAACSIAQRSATDAAAPVFQIAERSVWEVTFDGISVAVPKADGTGSAKNLTVHTLSVWLDATTGAPIKLFTPVPPEGGMAFMSGDFGRRMLVSSRLSLQSAVDLPATSLTAAFRTANAENPDSVLQAKEIVAYYGHLTDTSGLGRVVDVPVWFVCINMGGLFQTSSAPVGTSEVPMRTETLVVIRADTGKWHANVTVGPSPR